jgi:DNA invertase Pin-like site-specific DNA recombinase
MVNALVVYKSKLPRDQKKFRAAQYVRMSTERQQYSIENQAATIAAYAHAHDFTIVRTSASWIMFCCPQLGTLTDRSGLQKMRGNDVE